MQGPESITARSSVDEAYSSDSDLYDSDYEALMGETPHLARGQSSAGGVAGSTDMAPPPPLPQRSMSVELGSSLVGLAVAKPHALGTLQQPGVTSEPKVEAEAELKVEHAHEPHAEAPNREPKTEQECAAHSRAPVPASPTRDPRLKLLVPSSPGGSAVAARDPRLHLFNRRQRARVDRALPATTATTQPRSKAHKSRVKSSGLTVKTDNAAIAAHDTSELGQTVSDTPCNVKIDEGYQTLARIERCLDTGGWQERLAALTELTAIADGGAGAHTPGATLRYVIERGTCCDAPVGQLGITKRGGGKSIKASRGRTLVRGLEQQLSDQRPMILRQAAAAIAALSKLCGTQHRWQATSGQILPRLCSMCTLGPKLVCAAADAAVTSVLEETQPPVAVSVLITVATTGSMPAARRAHAFDCLGKILRCAAWADRPVLTRHRSDINAALTSGLEDADSSVRASARATSAEHSVFVGVATVTSPRGELLGRERSLVRKGQDATPTKSTRPTSVQSAVPSTSSTHKRRSNRQQSARQQASPASAANHAISTALGDDEKWIRDVTPSGNVFHYHRHTGEIRTKWSGKEGQSDSLASQGSKPRPNTARAQKKPLAKRGDTLLRRAGSRPRATSSGPRPRKLAGDNPTTSDRRTQRQFLHDSGVGAAKVQHGKADGVHRPGAAQQMSPGSQPLSSHRLADGPSTKVNMWVQQGQPERMHGRAPSGFNESHADETGFNGSRSVSPPSPVLQAEQEARIRAQRVATAAQDTHDQIRLELDYVQREISQISSPGKINTRAATGGDDDVPMVTIDLEEEMLPTAASQAENTKNAQKRKTVAGDRYLHANLNDDYHRNSTEEGPGTSNSSAMRIADAVEDADAVTFTAGSRSSTGSIANVASSTSHSLSSPSPEQVDRLVPFVRTVLKAEAVKTVRASRPRNIHDIL